MKKLILFIAMSALCGAGELPAPSPVRAQFTRYLEAVNSGSPAVLNAYFEDNLSSELDRDTALGAGATVFNDHGPLDLVEVTERSPTSLTATLRGRTSHARLTLTFEVEPRAPYRMRNFSVLWNDPAQ